MARRVQGLSYAEIREQMGLSFKIIEKEMARAIAHINRAVGRE
jgi:DNA-directed RNA polymerase specialized sigma24 family protein